MPGNSDFIQQLFAERLGGNSFGKDTKIYKFEKIKRAKRAAMEANPSKELFDLGVGEPDEMAFPGVIKTLQLEAEKAENRGYTDNGIQEFKDITSKYNDPLIDLIINNGGIIIGLTNMDEAAFGGDTSTSFYGTCENPLNINCSVGGSSGGSAAAISSGLVNYAIGTDTMGSVRIPASYCGITSFKPSSTLNNNNFIKKLSKTYRVISIT